MQVVHPVCCGIDGHAAQLTAGLRRGNDAGQISTEWRAFGTPTTHSWPCGLGSMSRAARSWCWRVREDKAHFLRRFSAVSPVLPGACPTGCRNTTSWEQAVRRSYRHTTAEGTASPGRGRLRVMSQVLHQGQEVAHQYDGHADCNGDRHHRFPSLDFLLMSIVANQPGWPGLRCARAHR
jgi:hypothetical protein